MINPKVTLIIPAYNCEKFIYQVVLSCLNQTYINKEIIIVDNESTDSTLNKINELKLQFPELIVDTAKNIYKYSWQEPVEKAWSLMTGDYFCIIGADDVLHPSYISNCLNLMLEKNLELLQSHIYCFNNLDSSSIHVTSVIGHDYENIDELKLKMLSYCSVASPSVFYKSEVIRKYNIEFSSEKYLGSCDYHMYCSLIDQGAYIYPAKQFLGYFYRSHALQSTHGMNLHQTTIMNIDDSIRLKFRQRWL